MNKKDKVLEKIKNHCESKLYAKITRGYKKDFSELSEGYIMAYSKDFILLREVNDFMFWGYSIFPISSVMDIRYNDNDKYYDFINKLEHPKSEFELDPNLKMNITSFNSIFQKLKEEASIIIECEKHKHGYFCIGLVERTGNKSVSMQYYNAQGFLDEKLVKYKFKQITKITFKDNYNRVFSNYTRTKE